MSEANHTPGPWKVYQDDYCTGPHVQAVEPNDDSNDNLSIAVCDGSQAAANARLIAAAPDLLAACKLALSTPGCVLTMEVGTAIEAAIAAVEGRR